MRLISLKAEDLYGSLDLDITFHNEVNLLVGINGSGKTSALSIIDWLLSPNIPKLATQAYKLLTIRFEYENIEYEVVSERSESEMNIRIITAYDRFPSITVNIRPTRENEESYGRLRPEKHEMKAWQFLHNIKKPTVVSLERTLTAEVEEQTYVELPRVRAKRSRSKTTPLEHVQEIFGQRYAEYRSLARKIDADLKSRIILTALHSPGTDEPSLSKFSFPREGAEQLESQVQRYLTASIPSENLGNRVQRFFSYFRSLSQEVDQSSERAGKFADLIQSQFERVDQLARAFNEYEERNATAFSRLREYLDSVNRFLRDSGKFVSADDSRGCLVFNELSDGEPKGEPRPISNLSSGESQIIVLFALMAFEASRESVFIVDEPELSLHPKWQTEFMESFLKLCPEKSQILIATHSPEIVAGRKQACVFF